MFILSYVRLSWPVLVCRSPLELTKVLGIFESEAPVRQEASILLQHCLVETSVWVIFLHVLDSTIYWIVVEIWISFDSGYNCGKFKI